MPALSENVEKSPVSSEKDDLVSEASTSEKEVKSKEPAKPASSPVLPPVPKKGVPLQKIPKLPRSIFGNVFFYLIIGLVAVTIFSTLPGMGVLSDSSSISEVVSLIEEEKVQDVTVAGNSLEVLLRDGTKLTANKESGISFDEILSNNNVDKAKIIGEITVEHRVNISEIISTLLMVGLPVLVLFLLMRQMKGASGDIMAFGKSRAKVFNKAQSKITFKDVAGVEEAKREMEEIVDFLKNPEKYRKLGARIPKGVLLVGPSGVGKTLLAKAIAGEAGVPFFSAAGSEFMEMLVGVGSSRVRDLFNKARAGQPSLIFIDEIDAIGRQRGMGIGGGHDEREQTLNQILTEMDGFDPRTDVIVLAATNRPDMLDPALIRPGRFDRRITIPLPDLKDREEIIKIHMRGKILSDDVNVEKIAKKTVGFSGADLENMLNESAILAARVGKESIEHADIEEASIKVTMGSERRTLQSEEEKRMTAYHEVGHALVAHYMPQTDPAARITIIARGQSLGHTAFPPERDRYNETETRLLSSIAMSLGGRAVEEVVFNEFTVGAKGDIENATRLARLMVTQFGMSPLGPVSYAAKEDYGWLARHLGESPTNSQEMLGKVDAAVAHIIEEAYKRAKDVVMAHRPALDKVAECLLEKETLDGEEFRELVAGVEGATEEGPAKEGATENNG
jgi:cell division protease FtsH